MLHTIVSLHNLQNALCTVWVRFTSEICKLCVCNYEIVQRILQLHRICQIVHNGYNTTELLKIMTVWQCQPIVVTSRPIIHNAFIVQVRILWSNCMMHQGTLTTDVQ